SRTVEGCPLLEEVFDEATTTRIICQAVIDRIDEIERTVEHEKALGQAKGFTPRNPDLHVAWPRLHQLRQSAQPRLDEWRKANPTTKQRVARYERQMENITATVALELNTLLAVHGRGARTSRLGNMVFGSAWERQTA